VHPFSEDYQASTPEGPSWLSRPGDEGLLEALAVLPRGVPVMAAVSGGPDSTALLLGLLEAGHNVVAAHFDHALRPGSERDAEHVAALCRRLGVELVRGRRDRELPRGSVQAGARALRYEFLEQARDGRPLVLLAHTADDLVEGAVLHLLRGSGLAGLRGMPARRGPFLRPLLAVWRSDLAAFLEARGVRTLEDPANADVERFARARVRHRLLPALERDSPGFKRRLWGAAASAARLQESLERQAAGLDGDRAALRSAPPAVRAEAYRRLFAERYGEAPALGRRHLEAMDRLAVGGRAGSSLDLPGGLRFRVGYGRIEIAPAQPPEDPPARLCVRYCSGCSEPGAVHLRAGLRLELGRRRPGLRLRPLGGRGSRKLQDLLTDARVPRHLRDQLPLVFAGGRLVWVPGVAVDAEAAAAAGEPCQHVWLEGGGSVPGSGPAAYHLV
jgi:tRNA(Ile)-lysidine synthetase-like protein